MKIATRAILRELARLQKNSAHEAVLLKKETARRELAESTLKTNEIHFKELLARSDLAREQKKLLAQQVILAQEEERKQISRTLHDEVSQILTGINVKLLTLSRMDRANERAFKSTISETRRMVEHSVSLVHRFARELRPVLLDELGLIPALHAFMKTVTRQSGLQISFTAYAGVEKLDNKRRTAIFRVIQSALNNVVRHAKATNVNVTIVKRGKHIDLEVRDDGKSFQVARVLQSKRFKRLGIISMRERIETFGGTLDVKSEPGKGTSVYARLPFEITKE